MTGDQLQTTGTINSLIAQLQMGDPEPQHPSEKVTSFLCGNQGIVTSIRDAMFILKQCETYFGQRDQMNALMHMAQQTIYSRLTIEVGKSRAALSDILGDEEPPR